MVQKSLFVCLMLPLLRNSCMGISIQHSTSYRPKDQRLYTFNWTRVRRKTCPVIPLNGDKVVLIDISSSMMSLCPEGTCSDGCVCTCSPHCQKPQCDKSSLYNNYCPVPMHSISVHGGSCLVSCRPGTHGVDCEYDCSQSCKNNCSSTLYTGKCSGTSRHTTNLHAGTGDCPRGRYGEGCIHRCQATCRDSCHHTDGRCLGGCVDGWTGDTCQNQVQGKTLPDPAHIALFVVGISLTILSAVSMVCFISKKRVNARRNRERNVDLNALRTQQVIYVDGNVQISCTQARAHSEPEPCPSVEEENVYEPLQPERAEREGDSTYQDLH